MKLDKDQIVTEALRLLGDVGLDGLTTRALAARLGVKQPALYWHFANRQALVLAMNDAILTEFYTNDPVSPKAAWQDYILALGRAFRVALLKHRDGARLHAGSNANRPLLERQLGILVASGFPVLLAVQLLAATGRFVVGWVLEEQAEWPVSPQDTIAPEGLAGQALRAALNAGEDAMFNAGLDFLVAGAEAALLTQNKAP